MAVSCRAERRRDAARGAGHGAPRAVRPTVSPARATASTSGPSTPCTKRSASRSRRCPSTTRAGATGPWGSCPRERRGGGAGRLRGGDPRPRRRGLRVFRSLGETTRRSIDPADAGGDLRARSGRSPLAQADAVAQDPPRGVLPVEGVRGAHPEPLVGRQGRPAGQALHPGGRGLLSEDPGLRAPRCPSRTSGGATSWASRATTTAPCTATATPRSRSSRTTSSPSVPGAQQAPLPLGRPREGPRSTCPLARTGSTTTTTTASCADPHFRYSVRVDGVFRPEFLERLEATFGGQAQRNG
jgi:hypothetical protein